VLKNDEFSKDAFSSTLPNIVKTIRSGDGEAEIAVPEGDNRIGQPVGTTANGGSVWMNQDGTFTYRPPPYFHGEDSFQYLLADSDGSTSWATVTLNVPEPQPAPPVTSEPEPPATPPEPFLTAVDDNYSATEHTYTKIHGSVLDNDAGDSLIVSKVIWNGAEHDVPADGIKIETALGGEVFIQQDGTFTYAAPVRDQTDSEPDVDSFQYKVQDANGNESNYATVHIDIQDQTAHIQGGAGHSELFGTAGTADVFEWSLADLKGADTESVTNTVKGFDANEGDKLDLRDLLHDESDSFLFDTEHLSVSAQDGNTTITVKPVDNSAPDLNIVIDGVDLTGGYVGQDAINHMIKNGTLDDGR
jgi:hypothetical protein